MEITVTLPPETERKLRERAAATGQDVAAVASDLIKYGIEERPTLDALLAPFRDQVRESQINDDELTAMFEDVREEVWREKHGEGR